MQTLDQTTAAMIALAEAGIPADVQELLVRGDPDRGIAPGAITKALNTRPAAPVEGLETVNPIYSSSSHICLPKGDYVARSQAEAIIAAATVQRDALIEAGLKCCNGTPNPGLPKFELALSFINSTNEARKAADIVWQDLKADNAALTARVKFLEKCVADQETQIVKQEASDNRDLKLIAALHPFSDIADLIEAETEGMSETDELILQYHDYEFARWPVSLFRQARAALEAKP